MTSEDALKLLLSKLDECGIPYMITGSFASNIHGLPRATQDADVVIEVEPRTLGMFLESLGPGFYRSREAAMDALAREKMFNVVHLETGFKVDLIVRKSRPFSRIEFSRRQPALKVPNAYPFFVFPFVQKGLRRGKESMLKNRPFSVDLDNSLIRTPLS